MAIRKKAHRSGLPKEVEERILHLRPEDLAVEHFRESDDLAVFKAKIKKDPQRVQKENEVEVYKLDLMESEKIQEIQKQLDAQIEAEMSEDHKNAEKDLALIRSGWSTESKNRGKLVRFMARTLKAHRESGALKSRTD